MKMSAASKLDTGVTFAVEMVNPHMAAQWLKTNRGNRQFNRNTVATYAAAMRSGEWVINGETVKFDQDNQLIDGQHRLHAVVTANRAVPLCIVRGLQRDVFRTLDCGKLRKSHDMLYILGYKNPLALSAALRLLDRYESSNWNGKSGGDGLRVSNDRLLSILDRHKSIVARADEVMRRPLFTGRLPHSLNIFMYYLAHRFSSERAKSFFTELAGDQVFSKEHPVRTLRDQLDRTGKEYIKPITAVKLAWTILAWNCYIAGHTLPKLSRIVDSMPRLVPDPLPVKR